MQSANAVNALHETCMMSSTCCNNPTLAWYVSVVPVINSVRNDDELDDIHIKASLSLCCQACNNRVIRLRRYAAQVNCDSRTLLWQMLVTDKHPIYFKQDVHVIEPNDVSLPAYTALLVKPGMIKFECGEHTLLIKAMGATCDRFDQIVCRAMAHTDVSLPSIDPVTSKFVEQVHDVLEIIPTTIDPGPYELCTVSQMHDECRALQTHCHALNELKSTQVECDGRRINSLLIDDTRPFRTAQVLMSDIDPNACCMELYGLVGEVRRLESMAVTVPGAEETFAALREQHCRLQSNVRCDGQLVDRRAYCIGIRAIEYTHTQTLPYLKRLK